MIVGGLLVVGAIALTTLRRYSLAHTATITSLALFLSTGLNPASAAPSYSLGFTQADSYSMEPWAEPCGTPYRGGMKRSPRRHNVHRTLKRVRTQLRVAHNHFRKELTDVRDIYSKVYKVLNVQYHMSWLPKNQLEWYANELWCVEKSQKAEYALPKLHDALQRFAITFYSLKRFRLKSHIHAESTVRRRNDIISGMQNEVLRMLCEVESAILDLELPSPEIYKATVVTDSNDWASEGDLTLMLIQDWGILRLYQAFLNDWTRAFRNATATGLGTCDPKSVIPIFNQPKKKTTRKVTRIKNKRRTNERKSHNLMKNEVGSSIKTGNNAVHLHKSGVKRRVMRNRRRKIRQQS
ncbi:hypothetical protein PV328_007600 [Microctonus aethiopoides]|uniref:Uncharacterized protein n=2 Tax=Microctonus aethiopoides TaxID=144406 RepID=A0AA39EZN8_9HYME|nr:hypothetical protein PV328_007600 [Microctonus aethiopoides]